MTRRICAIFICVLASAATQSSAQGIVFDPSATTACLADQDTDWAKLGCVGRAASACMDLTPGGYSTVGMGGCLDAERAMWDDRLNTAYRVALDQAGAIDGQDGLTNVPNIQESLRRMQRAWITYRDAACDFKRSKWGGGTGGRPATLGCLMAETARQTLILEQGVGLN